MLMRRRAARSSSDQSAIGWLYADVFLALMIVGFGSSVVVRQAIPSVSASSPSATPRVTRLSCQEFALPIPAQIADGPDAALSTYITEQFNNEITQRGWGTPSVQPAFVIVVGAFELYESAGDGEANARQMRNRLKASVSLFAETEMRTGGARSVSVNELSVPVGNNGDYTLVVYLLHTNEVESQCQ